MKLEIINKNKLKIAFTSKELEENGISVHSFLSNSKVIKKFIYAILEIAEEELNFTYKNYNYTLESFSFNHTHFIIYITTKSKLISSSPQLYQDNNLILFIFHNQNEFIEFLKRNHNCLLHEKLIINLYKYTNYYFLFLDTKNIDLKNKRTMQISFLEEHSSNYTSNILYSKIKEFGKHILDQKMLKKILLL